MAKFASSIVLFFLALFASAKATTYTVGDSSGWTYNVQNWPNGKSFNAGDILVFNYTPSFHNVVVVKKNEYNSCSFSSSDKTFVSGNDRITLSKGQNNFICGISGHCARGMKIAINAS